MRVTLFAFSARLAVVASLALILVLIFAII
jgi:hypothetical protein